MCQTPEIVHRTMGQTDLDGAEKHDLHALSDIAYDGTTFAEKSMSENITRNQTPQSRKQCKG